MKNMLKILNRITNGLYILLFGFVFLWISLGFIKFNILYQLLRLWPLFFVIVGIEMIFRKTKLSFLKIVSPIIVIISIIGIIYISQDGNLFSPREIEVYKINQQIDFEEKIVDVNLNFSSGRLLLSENENGLIAGDLSVPKGVVPLANYREFDLENIYEISGNSKSDYVFSPWDNHHLWDIRIGKEIPVKIKSNTYLSVNKFNTSNISVSDFILDSKLSSSEIIINDRIKKVRINSIGSKISLRIPKEMGVKISLNKFLITDNFKGLGMERGFKEYISSNYDSVTKKVDIDLDLKFSKIDIRYY